MWTYHLQKQLIQNGANITVSCVHPGMVNTELYRNGWAPVVKLRKVFAELFFKVCILHCLKFTNYTVVDIG